jgi:hypothetical protein
MCAAKVNAARAKLRVQVSWLQILLLCPAKTRVFILLKHTATTVAKWVILRVHEYYQDEYRALLKTGSGSADNLLKAKLTTGDKITTCIPRDDRHGEDALSYSSGTGKGIS